MSRITMKSVAAVLLLAALVSAQEAQSPSWILPLAPASYGGPGVINPYSNVNPLNPMAAEMQAHALGQQGQVPQQMMGPASTNSQSVSAAGQTSFVELADGVRVPCGCEACPVCAPATVAPEIVEDCSCAGNALCPCSGAPTKKVVTVVTTSPCGCPEEHPTCSCPPQHVAPEIKNQEYITPVMANNDDELCACLHQDSSCPCAEKTIVHIVHSSETVANNECGCHAEPVCPCSDRPTGWVRANTKPKVSTTNTGTKFLEMGAGVRVQCGCQTCPPCEPQTVAPEIVDDSCSCHTESVCPCAGKFDASVKATPGPNAVISSCGCPEEHPSCTCQKQYVAPATPNEQYVTPMMVDNNEDACGCIHEQSCGCGEKTIVHIVKAADTAANDQCGCHQEAVCPCSSNTGYVVAQTKPNPNNVQVTILKPQSQAAPAAPKFIELENGARVQCGCQTCPPCQPETVAPEIVDDSCSCHAEASCPCANKVAADIKQTPGVQVVTDSCGCPVEHPSCTCGKPSVGPEIKHEDFVTPALVNGDEDACGCIHQDACGCAEKTIVHIVHTSQSAASNSCGCVEAEVCPCSDRPAGWVVAGTKPNPNNVQTTVLKPQTQAQAPAASTPAKFIELENGATVQCGCHLCPPCQPKTVAPEIVDDKPCGCKGANDCPCAPVEAVVASETENTKVEPEYLDSNDKCACAGQPQCGCYQKPKHVFVEPDMKAEESAKCEDPCEDPRLKNLTTEPELVSNCHCVHLVSCPCSK